MGYDDGRRSPAPARRRADPGAPVRRGLGMFWRRLQGPGSGGGSSKTLPRSASRTVSRAGTDGRGAGAPDRRYVTLALVVLGLPVMMTDLHTDMVRMIWVIMAYLLVLTMLSTQVGRFGDMYGRVRMYNLGFAVFTVGSVLCGLSSSGAELIAFRVIQGIGGALITSNSGAIIADTVPTRERGRAYGLVGIGW